MTTGHFGFAAMVKSSETRVPLWALLVATYLMDIVFIFLVSAGVESFAPLNPGHPAYGQVIIHAYYSHSLIGSIVPAFVAGMLAGWAWGKRAGLVIGGAVFSHWVLDLIVHRPDLPIMPGNLWNLPLLGFGLWRIPVISGLVELTLAVAGTYLYYKSALKSPAAVSEDGGSRTKAVLSSGVLGILLLSLFTVDVLSLSLSIEVLIMLLLIVLCGWLDSRLHWHAAASSPQLS